MDSWFLILRPGLVCNQCDYIFAPFAWLLAVWAPLHKVYLDLLGFGQVVQISLYPTHNGRAHHTDAFSIVAEKQVTLKI